MKVKTVIKIVNKQKPNAYSDEAKIKWLGKLEGRIAAEVFLLAPAELESLKLTKNSKDWELLVSAPYDDMYTAWLKAMIDLENGEFSKYQNVMQQFNERWNDFVIWFANTYEPARGYLQPDMRGSEYP